MSFLESRFSDAVFSAAAAGGLLQATFGVELVSALGGLLVGVLSFVILNRMDDRIDDPSRSSQGAFDRLGGWWFVVAVAIGVVAYLILKQLW